MSAEHCIPRKRWDGPVYDWKLIAAFKEKSMSIPVNYEIREANHWTYDRSSTVHIEIEGIESLPAALRRLAEMGHDMAPALEVLQSVCAEQRKYKALKAAAAALAEPGKA